MLQFARTLELRLKYVYNYMHTHPGHRYPKLIAHCACLRMGRGAIGAKSNKITFSSQDRVRIRAYTRTRRRHLNA